MAALPVIDDSAAKSRSSPVTTSNTPGMERASSVSTDSSRAWAMGDRTNTTWAAPSSAMSAT